MSTNPTTTMDVILAEQGIVRAYVSDDIIFYDTKDAFDRHNFARDVKRNLDPTDYIYENRKYYPSAMGVINLAVNMRNRALLDAIMVPLLTPVPTLPSVQSLQPYMRPQPNPVAATFIPQPFNWTFHSN